MIDRFEFWDRGRTYTCYVERLNGPGSEAWWWFEATGDSHRYASFRANGKDTRESVKERVCAYHQNLLTRRAAPPAPHGHWGRGKPGTKPGAPGATPAVPPKDEKKEKEKD
jgi:hypothetical protein